MNTIDIIKWADTFKWATGDWLIDGMRHFSSEEELYKEAETITGISENELREYKRMSELFPIRRGQ